MTRVIVLAAFIASAGSAANAQTDVGEIRLTVTGAGGAPIVAAGTLASDAPQMRRSFVTDAEGRFTLGVVPLYIATGAGAEMRIALGTGVFWGMIGVTIFGLIFTPVFYVVIRRFSTRRSEPKALAAPAE